jgi:hypothetical protein
METLVKQLSDGEELVLIVERTTPEDPDDPRERVIAGRKLALDADHLSEGREEK